MRNSPRLLIALAVAGAMASIPRAAVDAQSTADGVFLQSFLSPPIETVLTGISFGSIGFTANTIAFDLRQFNGAEPTGPSLFYFVEPAENGNLGTAPYFLPVNAVVGPNTLYAIVFERTGLGGITIGLDPPGSVPNGSAFHNLNGWTDLGADMRGFTPLYSIALPEPTTLLLLAPALAALGLAARRGWFAQKS